MRLRCLMIKRCEHKLLWRWTEVRDHQRAQLSPVSSFSLTHAVLQPLSFPPLHSAITTLESWLRTCWCYPSLLNYTVTSGRQVTAVRKAACSIYVAVTHTPVGKGCALKPVNLLWDFQFVWKDHMSAESERSFAALEDTVCFNHTGTSWKTGSRQNTACHPGKRAQWCEMAITRRGRANRHKCCGESVLAFLSHVLKLSEVLSSFTGLIHCEGYLYVHLSFLKQKRCPLLLLHASCCLICAALRSWAPAGSRLAVAAEADASGGLAGWQRLAPHLLFSTGPLKVCEQLSSIILELFQIELWWDLHCCF